MREPEKSKQPQSKSAAGEQGFAATKGAAEKQAPPTRRWHFNSALDNPIIVPGILVLVFVAFLMFDYAQLSREANTRLDLTAHLIAAELSDGTATEALTMLGLLVRDMPAGYEVYLTNLDGGLVAATGQVAVDSMFDATEALSGRMFAQTEIVGSLGSAIVAVTFLAVFTPLIWHAAIAGVALALLIMLFSSHVSKARRRSALLETNSANGNVAAELPVGLAHWSADGALLECNSSFTEQLGIETPGLGANYKTTMTVVTERDTCAILDTDNNHRLLEVSRAGDKTYLIDERPLKSGGFVTLVSDVSEQRAAEETIALAREEQQVLAQKLLQEKFKAEAASRAKTSFLAHLSHDVRTPLNHIIGFADLVAHQTYGPIGDARYVNYINNIKSSGEQLLNSFSEILELAQIEGGHLVLRRERFELADAIKSTSNRFSDKAERAGLTFDISMPEDVVLYTDRLCLERMLGNIVENAIRFTPNGGAVTLTAWVAEDGAVFEVTDTGIGISSERLADLDQPFVLGDAAFTRDSAGVGLGIAISRAIAELSGGELAIDSSPAVGTTVAISLPAKVLMTNKAAAVTAA